MQQQYFTEPCASRPAALLPLLLNGEVYRTLDCNRAVVFSCLPLLRGMVDFPQNNPYHSRSLWDHTIYSVSQVPPELTLRMTMLLHDIGKLVTRTTDCSGTDHFYGHEAQSVAMAAPLLTRLGISGQEAAEILTLIALHDEPLPADDEACAGLRGQYTAALLGKLLLVKRADILAQNPALLADRITQLYAVRTRLFQP